MRIIFAALCWLSLACFAAALIAATFEMLEKLATSLVSPELRARIYDRAAREADITVFYDRPFGDGTHFLEVMSDKLGRGYQDQQDIFIEGGELRFKKECDV